MGEKLHAIRRPPAGDVRPNPPRRRRHHVPASFNLCSALHHVCGGTIVLYENSCGVVGYYQITHDRILDLQMVFFEELLGYAAENPVVWER